MTLFTDEQMTQLTRNGRASVDAILHNGGHTPDHVPVVRLFVPFGSATWLITEIDPDDPDRAFGLCDLGMQSPEIGYVDLAELRSIRVAGLPIQRDSRPLEHPLSVYGRAARANGAITLDIQEHHLQEERP